MKRVNYTTLYNMHFPKLLPRDQIVKMCVIDPTPDIVAISDNIKIALREIM